MEKVNINMATQKELTRIIHIGKVRAEIIFIARSKDKFKDIFELSNICGLGAIRMNDVINQDLATV